VRDAGYTIDECYEAVFSCEMTRLAGFVHGFKAAGFTITEAQVANFTPEGLRLAGYSAEDLYAAEMTCKQVREAGFSAKEAHAAGFKWDQITDAGYTGFSIGTTSSPASPTVGATTPTPRRAPSLAPGPTAAAVSTNASASPPAVGGPSPRRSPTLSRTSHRSSKSPTQLSTQGSGGQGSGSHAQHKKKRGAKLPDPKVVMV
jgi:hypothetical protein